MNVTGIALAPPPSAAEQPKLYPELLASVLARYSRSNDGLPAILEKVDLRDPDASVDRILKFVDYGHASIGGLTGGLAVAIDDVSMWLAYKLFEIAQMADGQESSTRYITMAADNIPSAEALGFPEDLAPAWQELLALSFRLYEQESARLDEKAQKDPSVIRAPEGTKPAVLKRLRKNYALDRARYFIPLATRTNVGLVMTARMWAETVKHLDSLPQKEARSLAALLRTELEKTAPRLMRHSFREESYVAQAEEDFHYSLNLGLAQLSTDQREDQIWVKVDDQCPPFLPEDQSPGDALRFRQNRYGRVGRKFRRAPISFAWNNMALAEMRDLNRHRTGHRFTPMIQNGFYLPPEVDRTIATEFLAKQEALLRELLQRQSAAYPYALMLGSQSPFEHVTTVDKFIYEAELRTGMGAHFRYAEHLSAALHQFLDRYPEARPHIEEGTAEPE
ncbi:MAG: FAD-dependent thymidylate synthase [Opitutales bacterium]|nr:FAD-dependent thymidylate synthase [Opitutales bacterium]MCH8541298.1 FAD-dependent thymidylate synthase [Opitutales bacterium]